jgi:hypothetical protein
LTLDTVECYRYTKRRRLICTECQIILSVSKTLGIKSFIPSVSTLLY